MDFSKIISWLIPQGKVKSISIGGVKVWQEKEEKPDVPDTPDQTQLLAPTISISGDILSITDTSGLATSFDILVDGVVKGSVEVEQEETYTIPAGGWEFYVTPNFPTTDILQKDISFYVTYSGVFREQTVLSITSDGRIVVGSGNTMDAELYSNGEWQNDFNLSITFDSNQTVSKEFYDWFYSNAFIRSGGAN